MGFFTLGDLRLEERDDIVAIPFRVGWGFSQVPPAERGR